MLKEILEQFDVTIEGDNPFTVTGSDKVLRGITEILNSKGLVCDNGILGGLPEEFGMIMVVPQKNAGGYLVMSPNKNCQLEVTDRCLAAAQEVMIINQICA